MGTKGGDDQFTEQPSLQRLERLLYHQCR